jgi:hypothetical protein
MRKCLPFTLWLLLLAGLALVGCTLTPHINMGVDFDYYGGKFHARPNANIGVYGRP